MGIANLHETRQFYTLRKNFLNLEIIQLQSQKNLGVYSQVDIDKLKNAETKGLKSYYKEAYENDAELRELYNSYEEIPEFEADIEKINAKYQDQLNDLTNWENMIDARLTTASVELEEINVWLESNKSMLSSNIQDDFNYGLK